MTTKRSSAKPVFSDKCDTCKFAIWHTDKEWNFSIDGHKPLTFHCKHLNSVEVRGHIACENYVKCIASDSHIG